MMTRRLYVWMLLGAMLSGVITGCGDKNETPESEMDNGILGPAPERTIVGKVSGGTNFRDDSDIRVFLRDDSNIEEIAKGSFVGNTGSGFVSGGEFTITLPATVNSRFAKPVIENTEGLEISGNRNAKMVQASSIVVFAGIGSRTQNGIFDSATQLVFVNSDITVIGSNSEEVYGETVTTSYNLELKKGWNFLSAHRTSTGITRETVEEPESWMHMLVTLPWLYKWSRWQE